MRRLLGNKAKKPAQSAPQPAPNASKTTTDDAESAGGDLGAPTADQMFLAELAVILAEEEEAKKKEVAQQEQEYQEDKLQELNHEVKPQESNTDFGSSHEVPATKASEDTEDSVDDYLSLPASSTFESVPETNILPSNSLNDDQNPGSSSTDETEEIHGTGDTNEFKPLAPVTVENGEEPPEDFGDFKTPTYADTTSTASLGKEDDSSGAADDADKVNKTEPDVSNGIPLETAETFGSFESAPEYSEKNTHDKLANSAPESVDVDASEEAISQSTALVEGNEVERLGTNIGCDEVDKTDQNDVSETAPREKAGASTEGPGELVTSSPREALEDDCEASTTAEVKGESPARLETEIFSHGPQEQSPPDQSEYKVEDSEGGSSMRHQQRLSTPSEDAAASAENDERSSSTRQASIGNNMEKPPSPDAVAVGDNNDRPAAEETESHASLPLQDLGGNTDGANTTESLGNAIPDVAIGDVGESSEPTFTNANNFEAVSQEPTPAMENVNTTEATNSEAIITKSSEIGGTATSTRVKSDGTVDDPANRKFIGEPSVPSKEAKIDEEDEDGESEGGADLESSVFKIETAESVPTVESTDTTANTPATGITDETQQPRPLGDAAGGAATNRNSDSDDHPTGDENGNRFEKPNEASFKGASLDHAAVESQSIPATNPLDDQSDGGEGTRIEETADPKQQSPPNVDSTNEGEVKDAVLIGKEADEKARIPEATPQQLESQDFAIERENLGTNGNVEEPCEQALSASEEAPQKDSLSEESIGKDVAKEVRIPEAAPQQLESQDSATEKENIGTNGNTEKPSEQALSAPEETPQNDGPFEESAGKDVDEEGSIPEAALQQLESQDSATERENLGTNSNMKESSEQALYSPEEASQKDGPFEEPTAIEAMNGSDKQIQIPVADPTETEGLSVQVKITLNEGPAKTKETDEDGRESAEAFVEDTTKSPAPGLAFEDDDTGGLHSTLDFEMSEGALSMEADQTENDLPQESEAQDNDEKKLMEPVDTPSHSNGGTSVDEPPSNEESDPAVEPTTAVATENDIRKQHEADGDVLGEEKPGDPMQKESNSEEEMSSSIQPSDSIFEDFEQIKSSFRRLLSATSSTAATVMEDTTQELSSTAATVSEVTGPARAHAGNVMISSATAASGIFETCRREIKKRHSDRNMIVSFVQEKRMSIDLGRRSFRDGSHGEEAFLVEKLEDSNALNDSTALLDNSAVMNVARVLSDEDEHDASMLPSQLKLSCGSDLDQYRSEVSEFLIDTPRGSANAPSKEQSLGGKQLEAQFEAAQRSSNEDPVLRAAQAGAEARKKRTRQKRFEEVQTSSVEGKELAISFKRLREITLTTAATVASAAAPAIQEAKDIAANFAGSSEADEEEFVILGQSASDVPLAWSRGRPRVFSAVNVSIKKSSRLRDDAVFSARPDKSKSKLSSSSNKVAPSLASGKPEFQFGAVPISASLSQMASQLGVSSIGNDNVHVSTTTPRASATKAGGDAQQPSSKQEQNHAFRYPSAVIDFVAKKLKASEPRSAFALASKEAQAELEGSAVDGISTSIFANERRTSYSSSLSSPCSPDLLSLSSEAPDNDSQQESMATSDSATKAGGATVPPGVSLWDMVKHTSSDYSKSTHPPHALGNQRFDKQKPTIAVSFDMDSPKRNRPRRSAPSSSHHQEISEMATLDQLVQENESNEILAMETHIEHTEESERSDFGIELLPKAFNNAKSGKTREEHDATDEIYQLIDDTEVAQAKPLFSTVLETPEETERSDMAHELPIEVEKTESSAEKEDEAQNKEGLYTKNTATDAQEDHSITPSFPHGAIEPGESNGIGSEINLPLEATTPAHSVANEKENARTEMPGKVSQDAIGDQPEPHVPTPLASEFVGFNLGSPRTASKISQTTSNYQSASQQTPEGLRLELPEAAPMAQSSMVQSTTSQQAPLEAKKRQGQADTAGDQLFSAKSVKSDIGLDGTDSASLGFFSEPSAQFNESGSAILHIGSKRARDRLSSPQGSVNWATVSSGGNASFSGGKKGPMQSGFKKRDNRRRSAVHRKSTRRLFMDDSMASNPDLGKSQEIQVSGLRRSLSGNELVLLPANETGPSISFHDAPEIDDISDAGGMLDLALMAFSSATSTTIFSEERRQNVPKSMQYVASVRWRQLVSKWKHAILAKALTERPCSVHYKRDQEDDLEMSDDEGSTISTVTMKRGTGGLELLSSPHFYGKILNETKNLNGLIPHLADGEMATLSGFLESLGSPYGCASDVAKQSERGKVKLAHILPKSKKKASVRTLVDLAESNLKRFAELLQDLVNVVRTANPREEAVSYSIGVKGEEATKKKAQRKYEGDILQVKDILRGEFVFVDESSLVIGLLNLCRFCTKKDDVEGEVALEIVRVKNLFHKSVTGVLCPSTLPTGYRHVLVNIRLNGLLLAEIQFQLAEMFEVLGYEGHKLHMEVMELEDAFRYSVLHAKEGKAGERSLRKQASGQAQSEPASTKSLKTQQQPQQAIKAEITKKTSSTQQSKGSSSNITKASPQQAMLAEITKKASGTQQSEESSSKITTASPQQAMLTDIAKKAPHTKQSATGCQENASEITTASPQQAMLADITKRASSTKQSRAVSEENSSKVTMTSPQESAQPAVSTKDEAETDDCKKCSSSTQEVTIKPPSSEQQEATKFEGVAKPLESKADERTSLTEPSDVSEYEPESDEVSINLYDDGNRLEHLKELRKNASDYTKENIMYAIQTKGIQVAGDHPRDVPVFFCLYFLLMLEIGHASKCGETWLLLFHRPASWPLVDLPKSKEQEAHHSLKVLTKTTKNEENSPRKRGQHKPPCSKAVLAMSKQCLLRSLAISNQGTSVGMTGWLEYGAGNSFGRISNVPFLALRELAYSLAVGGDWHGAMDVLRCQVSRCDQHLPLYHPTTLSSMLDLAGTARKAGYPRTEREVVEDVRTRLSFYLAEQEEACFYKTGTHTGKKSEVMLRFEDSRDPVSMLQGFVDAFQTHFDRELTKLVGYDEEETPNHILLVCHLFSAESLSVLANCVSAGKAAAKNKGRSRVYWHAAYQQYQLAFKGFLTSKKKLSDDKVVSAACGIARCLRHLKQRGKASQILSLVVAALGREERETSREKEIEPALLEVPKDNSQDSLFTMSFVPCRGATSTRLRLTEHSRYHGRREQLMALCLWLMSVFAVEDCPNERGRMRALSLLHAASEALRSVVSTASPHLATASRIKATFNVKPLSYQQTCRELLLRIEQEAKDLFEPVENAAQSHNPLLSEKDHPGVMI